MNSVILIGRLATDPQTNYSQSGTAVCKFTIAVDRQKEEKADFIRVTVFGATAENCGKYLAKGRQIGVSGKIQTSSYPDKNGKTVYTTEVVADRVEFLGNKEKPEHIHEDYRGLF